MATAAPQSRFPFPSSTDAWRVPSHGEVAARTAGATGGAAQAQAQAPAADARQPLGQPLQSEGQNRDLAAAWVERVGCIIQQRPLEALAAALALGLIVTRLHR